MASTRKKSLILQPLRQSTWPVMRKSFARYGFGASDILTNWRAIVGDELAQRAVPHRISWPGKSSSLPPLAGAALEKNGGTLIVQAEDGPSAVEIQYQELEIVERINVFYGYSAIVRLKVIQGIPGPGRQQPLKKRKKLSDEQNRHLDSLSQTTLSDPLANALHRLGEQIYGKSK